MRSIVLATLILMALPAAALAGGMNLTWGTGCWQDNPSTLQTFSCDSNVGSVSIVVSFTPSENIDPFSAFEATVDLQSDSPDLPDWWQLTTPGGCRAGALSVVADHASTPGGCANPWPGQDPVEATAWITSDFPGGSLVASGLNRAILYFVASSGVPGSLQAGTEYYGMTSTITFENTIGLGECTGCTIPSTLVLNRVRLAGNAVTDIVTPIDNMCLRWQADGTTPCAATPVQNRTWGQVKSLYR